MTKEHMTTDVVLVDYHNPQQASDLVELLNHYALDPMGGGAALPDAIKQNLASELAKRPFAFSLICYVDGEPAGMTNCFEGFSTFKCKPLINIHDLAVHPDYRGGGVSQAILEAVEKIATEKGCCKITLEVLAGNDIAKNAYIKFGFEGYELNPQMGSALFWQKNL